MNAAIRTVGLTKRFGRTDALSGVDLTVPEGSIYALVGPNGAGKTTLIKLAMNILQPTAGTAEVLGKASHRMTGRDLNRIGYVSENQEYPEWMTVGAMLAYLRPFYPTWDGALEQQLMAQFDLPPERKIKQLSRGMRMKAAMAAALAFRPALLVLDEPFSGLDPLVRDELIEGLLDRSPETTVFLSSHDLSEIESFSSHVGYLEQGRLLFSEEMAELAGRFREVTVTLSGPRPESTVPAPWLQYEATDSVVKFVHSGCKGEQTATELRQMFPGAKDIEMEPMPLRAIFLAVARARRAQRVSAGQERSQA
ncbi:MAG TPA: ABC transporter ATP-binding protein [Acidobacteriaceae bacterium]|nr:ABC transporter ATP-binding protein [Acidobacteriaceae bacterium]